MNLKLPCLQSRGASRFVLTRIGDLVELTIRFKPQSAFMSAKIWFGSSGFVTIESTTSRIRF